MSEHDASAPELARRGLLRISDERILDVVDELDLRGHVKVTAVIGVPLKRLQQSRDVTTFAVSAPSAAVRALLELVATEGLERVVTQLGDAADSPTYEELSEALDTLSAAGMSDDDLISVLVTAISEGFPAAGHCRRLLSERDAWQLPALPERREGDVSTPRAPRPEVKEQRKARREAQKQRKKPNSPPRPVKAKKSVVGTTPPLARPASVTTSEELIVRRRDYRFTPRELERFDPHHALAGTVVLVDVPFDAVDPEIPEVRAKQRPALVVAGSDSELLVRPIYSSPAATRALFSPWRRLGLDHHSYVDDVRVAVRLDDVVAGPSLGTVTDDEWNDLF